MDQYAKHTQDEGSSGYSYHQYDDASYNQDKRRGQRRSPLQGYAGQQDGSNDASAYSAYYGGYSGHEASGPYNEDQNAQAIGGINPPASQYSDAPYSIDSGKQSYDNNSGDYNNEAYGGYDSKKAYGDAYNGDYYSRDGGQGGAKRPGAYDDYGSRGYDDRSGKGNPEEPVIQTIPDTIYVSNLSEEVTEEKLVEFFGNLGRIKIDKKTGKPKVWIYYDKVTNRPKGDATLTFDDPDSTTAAIDWFNNKEFLGQTIKVEMSVRKMNPASFRGGGRGRGRGGFAPRGGRGGGGGAAPRDGDWTCESCQSNNFARRSECFKCRAPRADGAQSDSYNSRYSSHSPSGRGGGGGGGYRGRKGGYSHGNSNNNGGRYHDNDRSRGYRHGDSGGYGGGYQQGYQRPAKGEERRDTGRFRPY